MSTSTIPDRNVDVPQIEKLLADRMEAKSVKNYAVADKIAKTLQEQHIAYNDEQKTWFTKPIPVVPLRTDGPQKLTKKQERNKRQAEKNRRKKTKSEEAGDDDESSDDSEEEEEEKPKKKSKKA